MSCCGGMVVSERKLGSELGWRDDWVNDWLPDELNSIQEEWIG